MIIALLIGLLSMLCSYMEGKGILKNGLKMAFGIITVYLAIRYDFGNDYLRYLDGFYAYQEYHGSIFDIDKLRELHGHGDYGWVFINILFSPFSFFIMIIVLTIFENWVIYDFVKTYVPTKWYPFALFIYVFNPYIMLVGCSMMRQWLAICIFIFAFRFIRDRKPIQYYICIVIAISMHGSAFILLPFYFISYLRNISLSFKSLIWFVPLLVGWFLVAPELFAENLKWILSGDEMDKFSMYTDKSGEVYGIIGVITAFLFPLICISQTNKFVPTQRLLIIIFFFSIFIRPFGLVIGMILRLGFYFVVFSIVVFPMVMEKIQKMRKELVIIFLIIIVIPTLRDFFAFFYSEVWREHFMHYQTIFSVPWQ